MSIYIKNDGRFISEETVMTFAFCAERTEDQEAGIRDFVLVSTGNRWIASGPIETENLDKDGNLVLIVQKGEESVMKDKHGFSVIVDKTAGFVIFRDGTDQVRLVPFSYGTDGFGSNDRDVMKCDLDESDILPFSSHTGLNRPYWTKCDEDDIEGITDYLDDLLMGDEYGHIGLIARNLARIA